jgi:hypothetical protein
MKVFNEMLKLFSSIAESWLPLPRHNNLKTRLIE